MTAADTHPDTDTPRLFGNLFLSAGAMKAGTTWLYSVMERHPDLHFTPEKEIHYFYARYVDRSVLSADKRMATVKRRYVNGINPEKTHIQRARTNLRWAANYLDEPLDDFWYANLFTYPRKERFGADFSNLYALLPAEVWPRIAADCAQLKVLYTLRHPLKRLWSHVKFHLEYTGQLDALDKWRPKRVENFVRQPFLWQNAEYGQALRAMKAGLAPENLKVIFFEDLHADQRGTLADIERFIGLEPFEYPQAILDRRINESASLAMPDYFPELFAKDIARINAELEAEGLTLPASWTA